MGMITCPTGLSGVVRKMKVRDERILSDRQLVREGRQTESLIEACWTETSDPGPYDFGERIDWRKVLQGDQFFALMQIRIETYGPIYTFKTVCQEDNCRKRFEWEFDLHELPVRRMSEEALATFQAGNRFESRPLPNCGKRVWFKLMTGADQRKLPLIKKNAGNRLASAMLAFRTLEIEGVESRDKRRFFDDLDMDDADFLTGEFDRVDCGVDTTIDIECPECFAEQTIDLPFGAEFFMPGRSRRERKETTRRRREMATLEDQETAVAAEEE